MNELSDMNTIIFAALIGLAISLTVIFVVRLLVGVSDDTDDPR